MGTKSYRNENIKEWLGHTYNGCVNQSILLVHPIKMGLHPIKMGFHIPITIKSNMNNV